MDLIAVSDMEKTGALKQSMAEILLTSWGWQVIPPKGDFIPPKGGFIPCKGGFIPPKGVEPDFWTINSLTLRRSSLEYQNGAVSIVVLWLFWALKWNANQDLLFFFCNNFTRYKYSVEDYDVVWASKRLAQLVFSFL